MRILVIFLGKSQEKLLLGVVAAVWGLILVQLVKSSLNGSEKF
jgi:hypothetical protein